MTDTGELLRRYVQEGSEQAFGEVVQYHIDLVYSTAARRVGGDIFLAEDITQLVFIDLARKARSLVGSASLGGWLYRHTCFRTAEFMRSERRRQAREQTAMDMNALSDDTDSMWKQVAPFLDEAMERLNAVDRDAIVLRYFEQRDLRGVGAALGTNEDAAQKRVSRALDKLRVSLVKRGVSLSIGTLATILGSQVVTSAPLGLAASVAGAALAYSAASTGVTLTLLKLMTMTKLKVGAIGALVAAGVATTLVMQHQSLTALRGENRNLREENQRLAQLHDDNDSLSNQLAQARQSQPLSKERLAELLGLRSQVALLRDQVKKMSNGKGKGGGAAPWDPDKDPNVARAVMPEPGPGGQPPTRFTARVAAGQTLVSGGWVSEPGKRIFMLSTPTNTPDGSSVLIESRLLEVSDAVWEKLGLERLRETPLHAAMNVLGVPETAELINKLKDMDGVAILAAPRIATANLQEATISTESSGGAANGGANIGRFRSIGVTPRQRQTPDGSAFDLVFDVQLNRSAAGETSSTGNIPKLPQTQP